MQIQNPKRKFNEGFPLFRNQHYRIQTTIFDVSTLDVNPLIFDMNLEILMQPWKLTIYLPMKFYKI